MSQQPPQFRLANDVAWARAALESALASAGSADPLLEPDSLFGDYQLLETLDRGATATVYRARQLSLNRVVALKLMRGAGPAKAKEVQRFRFGAEAAAELDHPNIAAIYQVGEQRGVPFISMRLLEGGNLAQAVPRFVGSQVAAVELMAKVARAVQYAHERGVLHRDLKPANIMLDKDDQPYVVDFGFAKHLDERMLSSKQSILVGTMHYLSPEQAAGATRSLTFASDIYALGAILYELLTGSAPLSGLPLTELVASLSSPEPVTSPRSLDANIDSELDLICGKCLEKDPRRRYASAAQLARDLESWLACKPISIRPDGRVARMARWCRAHPAFATLIAGTVCVLAATASVALSTTRELEQALLSHVLHANADAAQARAGQVLFQLRELSAPVARCAADARIEELFTSGTGIPGAHADRLLIECGAKTLFDSVALIDRAGNERARLPRRSVTPPFSEIVRRDYYVGARRLAESGARSIHVGRVLRSEDGDGARRMSLSTPVFDEDNQWLGIVNMTVDLSAFLEGLQLPDSGRQIAVLAGVREPEAGDAREAGEQGVMVLLHKQREEAQAPESEGRWLKLLKRIKEEAVGRDQLRSAARTLEDTPQTSPVTIFRQRWLAAFAPVGHTGFGVIVQTQYESALEEPQRALARLLGWSGAVFLTGALAVIVLARTLGSRARVKRA